MAFRSKANSAAVLILTFSSALSAAPRLGLSTATVGPINTTPGANGPTQIVEAFNLGDGALNPSAISSASWLAVTVGSQKSCTTRSGNCYPVSILLNTASLAAGTYTEYVTVTDANAIDSPQDIAVTINNAGVPGSLTVYAQPANGVTGSDLV